MNWFKGGIVEAVSSSKSKGAIFVVYIEGKDDKSSQFTRLIDEEEIAKKLGSDNFVAIKIEAESVPHQQFTQIYKDTPIPSIYFIGKQGTPLEIITEAENTNSLNSQINGILQKSGISVKESEGVAGPSESLIRSESNAIPPNVVCEDGVCTVKTNEPAVQNPETESKDETEAQPDLSAEEKVERAKQLIEKKRQEKNMEELEKERLQEIERRKLGQNVQQMKKWQNDQELKNLMEEREKEKRENKAARDRVLAQIAQDKAERASRFSAASTSQPTSSQSPPVVTPRTVKTDVARLQFRLPDGSSATQDFPSNETLEVVHTFIRENLNLTFSTYTLSTTFPRREFTDLDCSRTLLSLELVPTAVILILPISHGTVSTHPSGGINNMFWYIMAPFLGVFAFLKNFLFGTPQTPSNSDSSRNKRTATDATRGQPKRRAGETTVVRKHGNVHRLTNKKDSDDENNTWNGNSTQQM